MKPRYVYPDANEIVTRILDLMDAAVKRECYGPWMVIVGSKIGEILSDPYFTPIAKGQIRELVKDKGENTLQARILNITGMEMVLVNLKIPRNAIRLNTKIGKEL